MKRRRVNDEYIASWFSYEPVSRPAPQASARRRAPAQAARQKAVRGAQMRIAILGTRGIPARYGGFETFAEELSTRLVARGHHVTVYCRERHSEATLPRCRSSTTCLPSATSISTRSPTPFCLDAASAVAIGIDVALYCNAANAIFTWMPRLFGMPVALNVDGLERKRKKWNALASGWYHASEWLATWMPYRVVSDAEKIAVTTTSENYGKRDHLHRLWGRNRASCNRLGPAAWGSQPGDFFCTSVGWSRRTTRFWSARPSNSSPPT